MSYYSNRYYYGGYSSSWCEKGSHGYDKGYYEDVSFYRPDKTIEGKSISWCRDHDFIEVEDGLWSGRWYFETDEEWENAVRENATGCKRRKRRKFKSTGQNKKESERIASLELVDPNNSNKKRVSNTAADNASTREAQGNNTSVPSHRQLRMDMFLKRKRNT